MNLIHLDISYNQINQLNNFSDLRKLQILNLEGNIINYISGDNDLSKLINLTELNLKNNRLIEIQNLQTLPYIETLKLDNNDIEVLEGFQNLTALKSISLNNTPLIRWIHARFGDKWSISDLKDNWAEYEEKKIYLDKIKEEIDLSDKLAKRNEYLESIQILNKICDVYSYFGLKKQHDKITQLISKRKEQMKIFFDKLNEELQKDQDLLGSENSILSPPFEAYNYGNNDQPYLFVSYAHVDRQLVYPIIKKLHDEGIQIWYDEGIQQSEDWIGEIVDALWQCKSFMVFISNKSIKREYVLDEINQARERYKKKEIKIIPIYLEKTELPKKWSFLLGRIQAFKNYEMKKETFYRKLIKILKSQLS
ncbi:MAG: TIR domain-containing protein [Candidatus Lokiarchaeota archaeon]|nr:TIR domain-containing protein [Candidatus Lokiarchaeota archaeon]